MHRAWLVVVALGASACSTCAKEEAAPSPPVVPPASAPAAAAASSAPEARHKKQGHEDRHEAADDAAAPFTLDAKIGGATSTWQKAAFDKVPRYTKGSDGEGRDVWSLRDLAHTLVGPNARVVAIIGPVQTRRLDAAAWNDATRTPLLHTTRRGTLKFRWADKDGAWGEAEVADVSRVEIEP